MTKADSVVESAFMSVKGFAAMNGSSSFKNLLLLREVLLTCVVDGAGLSNNGNLNLTGISHLVLDLLCYLS